MHGVAGDIFAVDESTIFVKVNSYFVLNFLLLFKFYYFFVLYFVVIDSFDRLA